MAQMFRYQEKPGGKKCTCATSASGRMQTSSACPVHGKIADKSEDESPLDIPKAKPRKSSAKPDTVARGDASGDYSTQ